MKWLIVEDVMGLIEYPWTAETQRELKLKKPEIAELNSGKLISSARKGGTEYYLVDGPDEVQTA